MNFLSGIKAVGDVVNNVFGKPIADWSHRKTIKAASKIKVAETLALVEVTKAESALEMAKTGQLIEAGYDKRAQDAMKFTWKDEFLLIILVTPAIMCFIPGAQIYAREGFKIFGTLPMFYKILFVAVYASVFGLRWAVAPLINRWSNQKEKPISTGKFAPVDHSRLNIEK